MPLINFLLYLCIPLFITPQPQLMEQHITYMRARDQKKVTSLLREGRFVNKLLLTVCCLLTVGTQSHAQTWTPIATNAPHYNAGVMLLLTDGTVLCKTSSGPGQGNRWDKLTPNATGSYVNGTWSTIAPMADDRLYFSSNVLRDGRVYVAGGEYGAGGDNSEVYDPLTNTWTPCPSIIAGLPGISDANSEVLPDGRILQAVVSAGTKKNYIWDPATNTYTPTANCLRTDNEASWVKLPDESVLFVDNYGTTSERYIPATNTWVNDGTVPVSLYDLYGSEAGGGFLLPDGRVYFLGARPTSAYYTPSGTAAPGTWAAGPAVPGALGAPDAASAMMVNGNILMALSPEPYAANHFPDSTVFKVFNYLTNTYTAVAPPAGSVGDTIVMPCYLTGMLVLPDGKILYGQQGDDSYYEFDPGTPALAAGKPTINTIIENTCTKFTITGTLFNGISEGACYGDDWQNFTNYPLVRLKSGPNVYYARTTNWNSTGVMRGSAPDTAQFTLPAGLPDGPYLVEVVVNGNPSATYPLTVGPANLSPTTTNICAGATTNLSASISGGLWTSGNSATATIGSTSGTVTGNAVGTVTMTYGLGTCISTATVNIVPVPAAITPSSVTICNGAGSAMTDATPGGFWNSSDNFVATVTSGGIINSAGPGTATISYTQGGCVVTAPVTVNPLPGGILGTKGVCVGFTTALTNAITGGTWTSINTSVATVGTSSGVITGGAVGTSQIVYTLPTGCLTTTTVNVGSTTSPITGAGSMCVGSTNTLNNAAPGGSWSSSNTAVATVGSSSGLVSSLSVGTSTITYALGVGCYSTTVVTVSTTFTIIPSVSLAVSPGATLCSSPVPVTFVPTAINGGSAPAYRWYVNGTLAATTNSYIYTPATGDVVKCLLKSNAACAFPDTAVSSVTMTINPLHTPTIGITTTPGTTLCAGKLATFTAIPAFGGTAPKYLWSKNTVAVGTGLTYAYTPANGDVISCMLTSDYSCVTSSTANSNPVTMTITTPAVNSITIKVTKLSIGAGQRDTFTAVAPHAGVAPVYQWYLNGVALPGETKVTFVTSKLVNGDIVKCSVVSSEDCVAPDKAISGGIGIKVGGSSGVSVREIGNTTGGFTLTPNPNNGAFTINGTL
ncbi:MAG: type sorting protein, partial [Flavipsychrobacter sp.]|nr:type sorting protein [Flavipsychrobacter sp.]